MKKNTASQTIGIQMITAADGTAFTGSVTCSYTIDGGTQTAGATVTHEGNGFYTMPVSAALSNGDHIGFTFIGTGAIPATVQVYTMFPQSVDNDTKISLIPTTAMRGTDGVDTATMRGTDSAALASVCTEVRLAELAAANLPADIDGIKAVTIQFAFTVANQVDANAIAISGDTVAADNLELQYDTTGLLGDTFPSTQAQVGGIGASSGGMLNFEIETDNTGGAIKGVTFVGVQTGTFADTEAEDGVYHVIDDTGNAIDIIYQADIGGSRLATQLVLKGFLNSANDALNIQAYNFVGSDWETRAILDGQGGSTNITQTIPLLLKHTGSGSDLGKVLIRFQGTGLTNPQLNVDELLVEAAAATSAIGFEGGAVWLDTVNGISGVAEGIGFINRPSDNITDALSIASSNNLKIIHSLAGTSFTLPSSVAGLEFKGFSYTVALNGQSVSGALFENAIISGDDSGTNAIPTVYSGCLMGSNTLGVHNLHDHCGLSGDIILAEAGTYTWVSPVSHVAGAGSSSVDFQSAVETKALNVRGIFGGLEMRNYNAGGGTHTMTLGGTGQRIFAASCAGGTLEQRGQFKETDNAGGAVTVVRDLVSQDTRDILDDTGTTGVLLDATATSDQLVNDIWDEVMTSHTINNTAGKILKGINEAWIADEGAVNDASSSTTEFISDLTQATTSFFSDAVMVMIDGVLKGQARVVTSYNGSTKTFTFDEAWSSAPANATNFIVIAGHTHPISEVQAGLATTVNLEARTPTAAQLAYMVANAARSVPLTFTTAGGSTTAAVLNLVDSAGASATDDQYNGRLIVFSDGTLKDVVTDIKDYDGTTKAATITAIPFAPTSSHTARLV